MTAYLYRKAWWDKPPDEKKAQRVDLDVPDPAYLPGQWVVFHDPTAPTDVPLAGRIAYVVLCDKKVRYEIEHGYTRHGVRRTDIECRMVPYEE